MTENAPVDTLDVLWRQVRAKPYRLDEAVAQVLALRLDLTEAGARHLLTSAHSPGDRYTSSVGRIRD